MMYAWPLDDFASKLSCLSHKRPNLVISKALARPTKERGGRNSRFFKERKREREERRKRLQRISKEAQACFQHFFAFFLVFKVSVT